MNETKKIDSSLSDVVMSLSFWSYKKTSKKNPDVQYVATDTTPEA